MAKKRRDQYGKLEHLLGAWVSKRLQVELVTVYCPEITEELNEVVGRLKRAAGVPDLSVRIVVVASKSVNAFSLPNGDVFISSDFWIAWILRKRLRLLWRTNWII